ncbi:MAG: hypothetical protein RIC36_02405 [Rhodospirillales bacterium]
MNVRAMADYRGWILFPLVIFLSALVSAQTARADAFSPFLGKFEGHVDTEEGERDLTVEIIEEKRGFRVNWSARILKSDGRERERAYSVWFVKTERPGIYRSAVKPNAFGGYVPVDPMKGEPYSWVQIVDQAMTMYALVVRDDGGYDMLSYRRELTDTGMHLSFSRVRDGKPLRGIEADLKRVD